MKKILLMHCITVILLASLYANGAGEVSSHKKANTALLVIDKYGTLTKVTDNDKLKGKLILPAEVKKIGEEACAGCWGVTEVDFSACTGLTEIGDRAFLWRNGLTSIDLSDCTNLTEIGNSAFADCTGLTSVDLSGCTNLSKIGYGAFQGCTGLTEVRLPASLNKIDENIFDGCTNLHTLTVDPANQAYCSKDNIIYTKDMKTLVLAAKDITHISIPDTVIEIGESAFRGHKRLTEIRLPVNLIRIHDNAFDGCTNLHTLTVDPANQAYCSKDNIIYTKDMKTLVLAAKDITQVSIPDTVTEIGFCAFSNCKDLTEVSLPANLIKIGIGAFLYCKKLTKVEFLCIILTEIGEQAFRNCTGLTELTFSSSLRKIGKRAFSDCRSLQKIYFPCTDLREIGKDAFPTSTTISIFATEENTDTIYNLLKQSGLKNLTKY